MKPTRRLECWLWGKIIKFVIAVISWGIADSVWLQNIHSIHYFFYFRIIDCYSPQNKRKLCCGIWFLCFCFFQIKYYVFQSKVSLNCCIYQCALRCLAYFKLTLKGNDSDEHHNYSVIAQTAAWLPFLYLLGISFHIFREGKYGK